MGDDSEWLKLPTDEKVQHKVWKARVAGYKEATALFQQIDDDKSPEFNKYAGLIKKFVTDTNVIAQEKALEAVVAFMEKAAVAQRVAQEVASGVVAKCLSATKQGTKDAGREIIMICIELEKQEVIEDCLISGLENKNPKVVISCIVCLRDALRDFGNKIILIKPMIKLLPKLLEDRDKNVREETKQLVIEIYRWVGAAIKPKLVDFKPLQVAELEAEFEKLPNEKPIQVRFLRSQQDLKEKLQERAAAVDAGEEVADDDAGVEEVDPYDLIEAVNIIPLIPKDFFEKVEAKKWQERREALEAVQKLVENPKIEPGDYGQLVRVLLKVVGKDSNVMLVALGAKCMASLAKGLRKKFSTYAPSCFPVIFDKFKEKKLTVVTVLREFADAAFLSTNLEVILEDLLPALDHKNPTIKTETVSFLARCFQRQTLASLPKKLLKAFCASLLKTVNDTALEVREASFLALGTAMKVVTEKNVASFLVDVDAIKLQKIKDCCEKAELLNAKGESRGSGGAKPAAAGSTQPKPVTKPPAKAQAAKPKPGAPSRSGAGPQKKAPKAGKSAAKKPAAKVEEKVEKIISDETFLEKAEELLSAATLAQLESSNWKERLEGMENFTKVVKAMSHDEIPCQVCVRAVCKKPGLKETNFQVLKLRIELISHLAQNGNFSRTTAEVCLPELVDKVGDVKNGAAVQETFSSIAEATSLEFVSGEVVNKAFSGKNPKNQSESLVWLSKAIIEFGMKIQVKQHLECLKKAFAATNPAVRTAAIAVVSTLYLYIGPQLRMFFEGEKAALLQQIDAEFEKVKGQKPVAPTRGAKVAEDVGDVDDTDGDDGKEEDVTDLVPRNDIGDKFSEELLESLSDKNWKVRGEGLQKVTAILNEAKFITGNLGGLPEAIKARLGDANKILITTTIGICATLAVNMGRHCKQHVKIIVPSLIGCFGDGKPQIRAAAVGAVNAWVDQTTLTPLVEADAFSDALKLENPNMRQELLGWLIERLPSHKPLPRDEMRLCVPPLLACLEDRNVDVRRRAQEALVPFMIHVGYDSVFKATSKLKPSSKDQIVQIIEKARENLPAKPQKTKKAAPAKAAVEEFQMGEPDAAPAPKKKSPVAEQAEGKSATKAPAKTKAKPAASASKKKKVDDDISPALSITETKEKRFKDEKAQKVLKWSFVEPRLEFVEQLKLQMEKNFNKGIMDQLFHHDFKQHIKAIEKLLKCMDELQMEQVANLDLILKWFTLRFFDTNPSMLNKGLEYLTALFSLLVDLDYHLHELEAHAFMPYLVIKVGENKDNVRRDVRALFKLIYKVYPASKMFMFVSDGIKSKNSKQRTECLEELGYLIETYGITICQPTPGQALKLIAGQISERDNGVRNAALNTSVVAYLILGEGLYKYIGVLNEKEQSYLDERIKRSSKNKAAAAASQPNNRPKTAPQQPQRSATQGQIQRPSSAVPKSASSSAIRREFQLDVDSDSAGDNYPMPELHHHDHLDELMEPIEMPKIKARPPSPGPRFLNSTNMASTVSFVISQVTNSDIGVCIQALAQIDEVLNDREKVKVMVEHVGQLLVAMSMQFKMAYSTHMADDAVSKDDIIRLYRCLLGTLLALFQTVSLATQATKDILKELINNLVTMLLDNRLMELDDGPQIVRSVNVLVVKIVEKSDQTNVLCALIRLLQECAGSETCSHSFLELIMKCLWKIVRMLPDTIKDLNLDRVLYDTHLFMKAFPGHTWKERSNDLPLRTIKTILHTMAKLKGSKILSHLGCIDAGEVSEVKIYLQKVLRNEGSHHSEAEVNGTEDNRTRSATKTKRLSKSSHDMLTEIFKKVGSKENTKEGLQDLYDFKKKYPEADLDPFLKKSSHFFQNYIERGLKSIESEREGKSYSTQSNVTSDGVLTTSQPIADRSISADYLIDRAKAQRAKVGLESNNKAMEETDAAVNPVYYMERLRMLRAQCGLDSNVKEEPTSEAVTRESASPSPPNIMTIEDTAISENKNTEESSKATDVSKLKERLARIKHLANS